jgi:hypothetical protein
MSDGNGVDVYEWLVDNKPDYLERCLFISGLVGGDMDGMRKQAPGCQVFAKGQDSDLLMSAVRSAAALARV